MNRFNQIGSFLSFLLFVCTQVLDPEHGGLKPFCSVRWSSIETEADSSLVLLTMFQVYCVLLVMLEYLAPLSFITLAYIRMAIKLWWSITPGHADQSRDDKILKNKKKVMSMS